MTLKNALKDLQAQMDALHKQMRAKGEEALKQSTTGLFEQFPEIEAISWTQYAPSFNDGDACTFSVHELQYRLVDDSDDDWCDLYSKAIPEGTPAYAALDEIDTFIQSNAMSDVLESLFGDGVRVVVGRDGSIEAEDYYHD